MHLGFGEIAVVILVLLLVFGPGKIPQLGDAIGKGIRNFKKAAGGDDSIDVTPSKQQQLSQGAPGQTVGSPTPAEAAKK